MEVLCEEETAGQIVKEIEKRFFRDFAVVLYGVQVRAARGKKFS